MSTTASETSAAYRCFKRNRETARKKMNADEAIPGHLRDSRAACAARGGRGTADGDPTRGELDILPTRAGDHRYHPIDRIAGQERGAYGRRTGGTGADP